MMKKSILSVLLMLFMVVSLVGCGNKKVSTPPEVDAETTTDIDESVKDDQTTADEDRTEGITSEQTEEESDSADKPTEEATEEVTKAPTTKPTEAPTKAPATKPTEEPTKAPTTKPTEAPTKAPTTKPTEAPTKAPTASLPVEILGINRFSKDGNVYVNCYNPNETDYKLQYTSYSYNVYTGKCESIVQWFRPDSIVEWSGVDNFEYYVVNNAYIIDSYPNSLLMDMRTREIIYALKENQYWLESIDSSKAEWCDNNTAFVYQRDSNYKGDTYSIGIINDKGEWVMPMKSDLPWGAYEPRYRYLGETYYFLDCYKTKYILNSADGSLYQCPEEMDVYGYYNGKVFAKNSWRSIGFYDFKNDKFTAIQEVRDPQDAKWDNKFWSDNKYSDENGFWYKMENKVYCVDANNNIKLSYDLSEFRDNVVKAVNKDYIVFWFKSPASVSYTAVMNVKGDLVFEPVNLECDWSAICKEGIVLGVKEYSQYIRGVYVYDFQKNKLNTIENKDKYSFYKGPNVFSDGKSIYKVNNLDTPINVYDAIFK